MGSIFSKQNFETVTIPSPDKLTTSRTDLNDEDFVKFLQDLTRPSSEDDDPPYVGSYQVLKEGEYINAYLVDVSTTDDIRQQWEENNRKDMYAIIGGTTHFHVVWRKKENGVAKIMLTLKTGKEEHCNCLIKCQMNGSGDVKCSAVATPKTADNGKCDVLKRYFIEFNPSETSINRSPSDIDHYAPFLILNNWN
jgi:hypothetical protein